MPETSFSAVAGLHELSVDVTVEPPASGRGVGMFLLSIANIFHIRGLLVQSHQCLCAQTKFLHMLVSRILHREKIFRGV